MVLLGFWQLDRAEFKENLQQSIEQRKNLPASGISELPLSADERRYLPVEFVGEFDERHSFLLDNRTVNGRVGYHVFTPVKVSDSENSVKSILIARGFVEMGRTREQLPEINSPQGKIVVHGLLDMPPSAALVLADNIHQSESWPVVLQYLDLPELSTMLGYELYDMVIWLNEDEAGSFEYDLPVLNLNAAKNNGYAFQWFAMSLALLIIYIVVNTKSNK
jgi:surfeit locus 1 family protein